MLRPYIQNKHPRELRKLPNLLFLARLFYYDYYKIARKHSSFLLFLHMKPIILSSIYFSLLDTANMDFREFPMKM